MISSMSQISKEQINLFRSIFNTRIDVFAKYWEDFRNKKSGYVPVYQLNKKTQTLTDEVFLSHLEGEQTIGVYPLFPNNTTSFLG